MTTPPLNLLVDTAADARPIHAMTADSFESWLAGQPARVRTWLAHGNFKADAGASAIIAGDDGAIAMVVLGLGRGDDPWVSGNLAKGLPKGTYRVASVTGAAGNMPTWIALAWALGGYSFSRYKSEAPPPRAALVWPEGCDRDYVSGIL